jgi:hypothetical protein
MIYRFKNETETIYPFAKEMLRPKFPSTSFPVVISDEVAAAFGCLPVAAIARPEHDPRTERVEEGEPEELPDGTLRQVLTVRPATPEEIAAWDASNLPPPDWLGFAGWLYQFPAIQSAMNAARASTTPQGEPATTGLPAAMDEARLRQNYPAFALSWGQFLLASNMAPADLAAIVEKAADCNLPAEFLAALQPEVVP